MSVICCWYNPESGKSVYIIKPLNAALSQNNINNNVSSSCNSSGLNNSDFEKVVGLEGVIIQVFADGDAFYSLNNLGEVFTWNLMKSKDEDENKMLASDSNYIRLTSNAVKLKLAQKIQRIGYKYYLNTMG